jgi:vacuolar-type H+-ATPase subunit E/Vma4
MSKSKDDLTSLASKPDSKGDTAERTRIYAEYQARLRAEEIDFLAREQYNADLQKLVNASYAKLNNDYELQRTEIDRRAKIQFSVTKNEQRIRVLTSQRDIIDRALGSTRERLRAFRQTPQYAAVLAAIIRQSLDVLHEKEAVVSVVPEDLDLAGTIIEGELAGKGVRLDRDNPLDPRMIGGALVSNEGRTIRVDNSFEGRLALAAEQSLPDIGVLLKPK